MAAAGHFHTVLVLEDGACVAFGSNHQKQINVPDLNGKKVVQAAAGNCHTVLVLEDGQCIAFGWNDHGQSKVPGLNEKNVKQAAAGYCHTVLVLEDGQCVVFGSNNYGQINLPNLHDRKVKCAAAGHYHTVLVLEDGHCVAFGWNDYGQVSMPDLIGKKVVQAAAGNSHTVLVLEDGQCITLGSNDYGQIQVPDLNGRNVKLAAAGLHHTLLVLEDGECVGFGWNDWGQSKVPELNGKKVLQAAAGDSHTVLVLEDGQCVAFGCSDEGRIDVSGQVKIPREAYQKHFSPLLGIQVKWIMECFPKDVTLKAGCSAEDMDFSEMAPIVAYGSSSYGYGRQCPRDLKMHCSIVDTVFEDGCSKRATIYLSWVRKYKLGLVLESLQEFLFTRASRLDFNQEDCYVWWCFFCKNLHRSLGDGLEQSEEDPGFLRSKLQSVGSMIAVIDRLQGCSYTRRLWCNFEAFVAARDNIPLHIIMPSKCHDEITTKIQQGGIGRLSQDIFVDVGSALATLKKDEASIKDIIREQSSDEDFNHTVHSFLIQEIGDMIGKALNPNSVPSSRDKEIIALRKEIAMLKKENEELPKLREEIVELRKQLYKRDHC